MERLRLETLKNRMLGRGDFGEVANLPLPPAPAWSPLPLAGNVPAAEIEPLAMHVPQSWFYVRFGRFSNYLWLNHLLEEYGGDISSMVTLRSYLAPMNKRLQNQFGLEQNVLGELLGDKVISDVALVGRDTFAREGAAMGIMFQAINTKVLKNDLSQQRDRALERVKDNGAKAETLQIAGREVSFYSTPDNRLRSFYAVDGDYHLVTTSRAMVEQFLAASDGRSSLGKLGRIPLRSPNDAARPQRHDLCLFLVRIFSRAVSPQYSVELERRMKSVTDIELLMLAHV